MNCVTSSNWFDDLCMNCFGPLFVLFFSHSVEMNRWVTAESQTHTHRWWTELQCGHSERQWRWLKKEESDELWAEEAVTVRVEPAEIWRRLNLSCSESRWKHHWHDTYMTPLITAVLMPCCLCARCKGLWKTTNRVWCPDVQVWMLCLNLTKLTGPGNSHPEATYSYKTIYTIYLCPQEGAI